MEIGEKIKQQSCNEDDKENNNGKKQKTMFLFLLAEVSVFESNFQDYNILATDTLGAVVSVATNLKSDKDFNFIAGLQ